MENNPRPLTGRTAYTCPTCGERMERDLLLFTRHTDAHIVEALKKIHPEWITDEGYCPQCLDHYKAALRGERVVANIAGREVTKRQITAGLALAASALLLFLLVRTDAPRAARVFLVLPFFAMLVGLFQAKKNHCVALGMKGAKNLGHGEEPVTDAAEKARLRGESVRILWASFVLASVFTAAAWRLF